MIRLFPRSPRGTWLLAGAVWLAGCGTLWWALPPAPTAEWTVPDFTEQWGTAVEPDLVAVNSRNGIAAIAGHQFAFSYIGHPDGMNYLNHYRGPVRVFDLMTGRELRR